MARQKPKESAETAPVRRDDRQLMARLAKRYGIEDDAFKEALHSVFPVKKDGKPLANIQMAAALVLCDQYDLNPFAREIFIVQGKGGHLIPIIPVDGYNKVANRHEQFDGVEFEWEGSVDDDSLVCTCKLYRKDRAHPIVVQEFLDECRMEKDTWEKWPRRMLRHKAYIQAIRYAFGLTAIDEDEADRMGYRVPEYKVVDEPPPSPRTRAPAKEVQAPPPPEARPDDTYDISTADSDAPKKKLLAEVKAALKNASDEDQKAIRKAAGVELFSMECNLAQLEAAASKASELAQGGHE